MITEAEFQERLAAALPVLEANAVLEQAVRCGVDAFFAAHPDLVRTPWAETIATVMTFDRLTETVLQPQQESEKTAA